MLRQLLKITFFLLIGVALILSSCSDPAGLSNHDELRIDDKEVESPLTKPELIAYFKEIAFGFEVGDVSEVTRKWNQDIIIYVINPQYEPLLEELERVVNELNELIAKDNVELRLTSDDTLSNFTVQFVNGQENLGFASVSFDDDNYIYSGYMYVNRKNTSFQIQKHHIREELTQALGLLQDSYRYADSIFQKRGTSVTEFSNYDKAVIKLLYHPKMKVGLDATQVDPILDEIVDEVIAEVMESEE